MQGYRIPPAVRIAFVPFCVESLTRSEIDRVFRAHGIALATKNNPYSKMNLVDAYCGLINWEDESHLRRFVQIVNSVLSLARTKKDAATAVATFLSVCRDSGCIGERDELVFADTPDVGTSKRLQLMSIAPNFDGNVPTAIDRSQTELSATQEDAAARRLMCVSGKARIEIRKGLVSRWVDLADFFDVPLAERSTFGQGADAAGKLLDWLDERSKLLGLRDAFQYLGMDDLVTVFDRPE
jgi:hypothetical protein